MFIACVITQGFTQNWPWHLADVKFSLNVSCGMIISSQIQHRELVWAEENIELGIYMHILHLDVKSSEMYLHGPHMALRICFFITWTGLLALYFPTHI